MAPEKEDYSQADVLLSFLATFLQDRSPYLAVRPRLVIDGSLRIDLEDPTAGPLSFAWVETARGQGPEVAHQGVVIRHPSHSAGSREVTAEDRSSWTKAAKHVARRIARLLTGHPPHLMLFRNRNPQRLQWSARLFDNLCPGMLVPGKTRFYGYHLREISEYEGGLDVSFEQRRRGVRLRLDLGDPAPGTCLHRWGPISLCLLADERSLSERQDPEHQVEAFFGYLISRNLPERYSLEFAHQDPPAGYLPPDYHVDFLHPCALDDSAIFEMLLAATDNVAMINACDRECFNLYSLLSSSRERWTTTAPWPVLPSPRRLERVQCLDLTTRTATLGEASLERCLTALGSERPAPELAVVVDSCLSKLVGEDIVGPVTRFRESSDIPVVAFDVRLSQSPVLGPVRQFWRSLLAALAPREQETDRGKLVFLGLHPLAAETLGPTLDAWGLDRRAQLFPHLSLDAVRALPSSSAVVANSWSYVRLMFGEMLAAVACPVTWLPLPYGVEGSRLWLESVRSAAVPETAVPPELPAPWESFADRFGDEKRALAGVPIGLFGRARDAVEAFSAAGRFGVPLLPFLRELGLTLKMHLYVGPEEDPNAETLGRSLGLDPGRGDQCRLFRDFREIPALIRAGDFPFVYTETFRDSRVTAQGKAPVSIQQLQPGFSGALRTARLLRAILVSGFYGRYHRFFSASGVDPDHAPPEDHHEPPTS